MNLSNIYVYEFFERSRHLIVFDQLWNNWQNCCSEIVKNLVIDGDVVRIMLKSSWLGIKWHCPEFSEESSVLNLFKFMFFAACIQYLIPHLQIARSQSYFSKQQTIVLIYL